MFQAQEGREVADIARLAGLQQQFGQQRMDALGAMGSNISAAAGQIGSALAGKPSPG